MKSIKNELLLIFSIVALSTIVLISILFFTVINNDITPFTEKVANQILVSNSKEVGNWIKDRIDTVQDISESISAKEGDLKNLSLKLQSTYNKNKDIYEGLFYTLSNGMGWDTSDKTIDLSYKEYFKLLIRQQRDTIITDPYMINKKNVFVVASVITDKNGKPTGIVGAYVLLSALNNVIRNINIAGNGYGWVVDQSGTVIAHPNQDYIMNFNISKDSKKYAYKGLQEIFNENKEIKTGTITDPKNYKKKVFLTSIPYSNGWYLGISVLTSQFYESTRSLLYVVVISMIALVLALVLVALLLSDNLSKSLKDLSLKIGKIESGTLDVDIEKTRKDEIGTIQSSLKNLVNSFNIILSDVKSSSAKIASVVTELAGSNEDFSKRILNDSTRIEQISATTQELTASFDLTAENANQSIEIGQKTILTTKENKGNMEKTVQSVKELSDISNKIGEIMNFINKVAFQTNLLAVNANVEAARFGKEGSGFAVVASEIRSLSRKISEYSLEIGKLLTTNQSIVKEVNYATENAKKSFESMEAYINDLVEKSNGISLSVVEQSDAIKQIADAIINMSASMQSNSEIMEEISKITMSLANEVEFLNSITSKYILKDDKKDG